jgi:hypothetical protein
MPELASATVYEVDHPASQQDKLRRIGGREPTAARVAWVAVDLAGQRLGPALEQAGFDRQAVTTWVWEGVVPYLTADQVRATVAGSNGFHVIRDSDLLSLSEGLGLPSDNDGSLRNGRVAVAVRPELLRAIP